MNIDEPERQHLIGVLHKCYNSEKRELFGIILRELIENTWSNGNFTKGTMADFGKGFILLENTWLTVIETFDEIEYGLIPVAINMMKTCPRTLFRLILRKITMMVY